MILDVYITIYYFNKHKHYLKIYGYLIDSIADGKQEEQAELPLSKTGNLAPPPPLEFLLNFLIGIFVCCLDDKEKLEDSNKEKDEALVNKGQ